MGSKGEPGIQVKDHLRSKKQQLHLDQACKLYTNVHNILTHWYYIFFKILYKLRQRLKLFVLKMLKQVNLHDGVFLFYFLFLQGPRGPPGPLGAPGIMVRSAFISLSPNLSKDENIKIFIYSYICELFYIKNS